METQHFVIMWIDPSLRVNTKTVTGPERRDRQLQLIAREGGTLRSVRKM